MCHQTMGKWQTVPSKHLSSLVSSCVNFFSEIWAVSSPRIAHRSCMFWYSLRKQRQEDSWCSLISLSSLLGKLQARKRPCLKRKVCDSWGKISKRVQAYTHTYTCYMCVHTHVLMNITEIKFDVISRKIIAFWPSISEALDSSSFKRRLLTAVLVADSLPECPFLRQQGEMAGSCSGLQEECSSESQAQRNKLCQASQRDRHYQQWDKSDWGALRRLCLKCFTSKYSFHSKYSNGIVKNSGDICEFTSKEKLVSKDF